MAEFQTSRTAAGVPARYQEKGVFCDVATYECSSTAADSILNMVNVAAGVTVLDCKIIFDALGTVTVDVGDGDLVDRFMDGVSVSSAGVSYSTNEVAFPRTYTTADTIDIKILGNAATGTITLIAYMTAEAVDLT